MYGKRYRQRFNPSASRRKLRAGDMAASAIGGLATRERRLLAGLLQQPRL